MSDLTRSIVSVALLTLLFAGGVLIGALVFWQPADEPTAGKVTHERTEIHHEPTIINRTVPTKETVREVTRWRTTPAPTTLPDTGGASGEAGGER